MIKGLINAYRDGLVTRRLLHRLEKLGLTIEFYYVYIGKVSDIDTSGGAPEPKLDNYESGFLGREDMKELSGCEEWLSEAMLLDRLERALKCFAVKHNGRIVSYLWCAFEEISDRCVHLKLEPNEVHLYNAYTLPEYRGKGLAPYMRYQCYQALGKMGIEKFYSHCDALNTPSVKYKEKTNTPIQKFGVFLALGKKYSRNWTLKTYDIP